MTDDTPDRRTAPVAIVGAGPVGLALALGLARQGVRSTLVERKPTTSGQSKAPAVHVRTREALRQWGVEQRFLDAGVLRRRVTLHGPRPSGRPLLDMDFAGLDPEADRPGLLVLEQSQTERLLLEAVRESGLCDVRFNCEAVGLDADAGGVRLTVREDGAEGLLEAEYVVGCDGAGSFVRDAVGLPFEGMTYSVRPMLADVEVADDRDSLPWPRLRNSRGGLTAGIRLRPGLWRLIRLERGEATKADDVPDDEVGHRAAEVLGPGRVRTVWASRFRIHRRSAPRFRVGRVLLAGDAAHVHSPTGGQGMNAGIQDAHNLAWKLALVLRGGEADGEADPGAGGEGDGETGGEADRLLDSYDVERRAVVVGQVTRYTDLLTRAFLQTPMAVRAAAFLAMRAAMAVPPLRRRALRRTAMTDLGYPGSPILDPADRAAGRRLPNPLLRARDGSSVRLHDLLRYGPAVLDVAEHRPFSTGLAVGTVVRLGPGGLIDPTGQVRDLLDGEDGWVLVRPDTHIAWARTVREGMPQLPVSWA